jgi:hypothetical protein
MQRWWGRYGEGEGKGATHCDLHSIYVLERSDILVNQIYRKSNFSYVPTYETEIQNPKQ